MLYTHGSKGVVVRQIQKKVGAQITGVWDTLTYRKVYEYQKAHGLHQTGEVNDETHKHMFPPAAKPKAKTKVAFKEVHDHPDWETIKNKKEAAKSKPAPKKVPPKSTQNGDK